MNHDPLCEWSTPCTYGVTGQHERDTENLAVPDASYCWMCGADCHCEMIAKARADERDKVAQRVATLGHADGCLIESDRGGHHCDCFLRRAIAAAYGEAS